ncbi:MAG: hypothetical protein AAF215_18620 [Cyanobacteria bacterium P01_A01_bin.123]
MVTSYRLRFEKAKPTFLNPSTAMDDRTGGQAIAGEYPYSRSH